MRKITLLLRLASELSFRPKLKRSGEISEISRQARDDNSVTLLKRVLLLLVILPLMAPSLAFAGSYGDGVYGGGVYNVGEVTATPTTSSSSGVSAPTCGDQAPGSNAPWLYGAAAKSPTSVELYFTESDEPYDSYALEYGVASGSYLWGATDIGGRGLASFLVQSLTPNTTYFFRVRAGNGCATGPWSNEISATTKGRLSVFKTDKLDTGSIDVDTSGDDAEEKIGIEAQTGGLCQTYTVSSGDTLTSIAQEFLGDGNRYPELVDLNKDSYPSLEISPFSIDVGWELTVSCDEGRDEKQLVVEDGTNIRIKIIDEDKEAVLGATVTLHSTPREETTNEEGYAFYENVEPGEHLVVVSYNGQVGEQKINIPEKSDINEIDFIIQIKTTSPFLNPWVMGVIGALSLGLVASLVKLFKTKARA